jgi:beta-glucosidase
VAFLEFPDGFLWGSGTSAHQVEGGNRFNDWWAFERQGRIRDGEVSGQADDWWHRYPADMTLAAELGHNAMKISVEWSRIERAPGVFDEAALDHYTQMLRTMRSLGLAPFVVLHHFTSPLWLEATGCWENPDMPRRFAAFARVAAERFGDLVEGWITINEPMLLMAFGYIVGYWPPQGSSWRQGLRAAGNLMRAHRLAYEAVKSVLPHTLVGVAVNSTVFELSTRPALYERLLMPPLDWFGNQWFLDRVRGSLDFIGLQYYSRTTVRQVIFGDPSGGPAVGELLPVSDMGWAIYPEGLAKVVRRAWRRYGIPLYVTENGIADRGDVLRKAFIHDHLRALHGAISEGADVRGYFHWALLDNFEWREGFGPRFGLIAVDYATQERHVRDSARYYESICRANGLDVTDRATPVIS